MSLYSFYRISKPSEDKVVPERVAGEYKHLRNSTFWGVTGAYALYYVCRMAMSVVKQPLIDGKYSLPRSLESSDPHSILSMLSASSPTVSSPTIAMYAVSWRQGF